jgi:tetrahydromethanopterin S-methyltransferase subunit F
MMKFSSVLALSLTLTSLSFAADYKDKQFSLTVNDQRSFNISSDAGQVTTGVQVFVYTAGTKTLATIYSDRKRTTKANPISTAQFATDSGILFYGSAASYDLFVVHNDGSGVSALGVTPLQHRVQLDRSGTHKVVVVPWSAATSANAEVDTGVDLPKDSIVTDVRVQVVTAESSKTLNVGLLSTGTGGSATGFVNAVSTTTAGYPALATVTVGSNENYLSAFTYGTLLGSLKVGVDTAGRTGQTYLPGYVVTGSNTTRLTYTTSSGAASAAGYFYAFLRLVR